MRRLLAAAVCVLTLFAAVSRLTAQNEAPAPWAYGFPAAAAPASGAPATPPATPPAAPPAAPDESLKRLPGSAGSFTLAQIRDGFGPADWYPGDHPAMPEIVARGRRPDVRACSLCHYPNGKGRPENAGISGLPYSYFVQTMHDFKSDARKSADGRKGNTNIMIAIAKAMTDDEIKAAAQYFSSMPWTPWIRVVESASVPKTRLAGGMFLTLDGNEKEPIGARIIETPEDRERTETLRDPRAGFVAYVPPGSVKKGESLVTSGGGRTVACGVCHGADLNGLGPAPGLAGRSPSYTVRQLTDMQRGVRKGEWTAWMKSVVARLNNDDMLNIAAYLASMSPAAPARP